MRVSKPFRAAFHRCGLGAFAGAAGGNAVNGVTKTGPSMALTQYEEVVEVTAIVGAGDRTGVDTVWGSRGALRAFRVRFGRTQRGVFGSMISRSPMSPRISSAIF